jgi:AraC-like DNA-binding protein
MRPETIATRQRLYLLARVVIVRHYRRELTLALVVSRLSSSPRQLQRAFEQFGGTTFTEDLLARRMSVAAQLLVQQRSLRVEDVARLVGYSEAPHFAHAFRRRYGLSPARFRIAALEAAAREATARRAKALQAAAGETKAGRATALQAGERP